MLFLSFFLKAESLLVISVSFTNSKTVMLQASLTALINQLRVPIRKIAPLTQTALAMRLPPFMITTPQRGQILKTISVAALLSILLNSTKTKDALNSNSTRLITLIVDEIVTVIIVMASQSLAANLAIPVPVPEILRAMFMV